MAINWFPGHMHKARKDIARIMSEVDVVIEVLDARIPYSSENPLVPNLRGQTPCIKLLNKADLADPDITSIWVQHMEQEQGVKALPVSARQPAQIRQLLPMCRELVADRNLEGRNIQAMIMGIPNVGKSTLINLLAGRKIAKTGDEAGVTKAQQRIRLDERIVLTDTPGFLWPKLTPPNAATAWRPLAPLKTPPLPMTMWRHFWPTTWANNTPRRCKPVTELIRCRKKKWRCWRPSGAPALVWAEAAMWTSTKYRPCW